MALWKNNLPEEQEGLYKALFDCNCDISEENRFVVPFIIAAAVPYGKLYKENLEVNPTVPDTFTALMNCSRTNQIAIKMITFALRMTGCCPVKIQRIRNAGTQQTSTQNDDIHTIEDDRIKQSVLFHKLLVDIINDLPADLRRQVIYESSEYLSCNPVHTQMLHVHFLRLIQGTVIGYKDVTKLHATIESIRRPDILDTIDEYCREVGLPVLHRQGVCSVVHRTQCHLVQGDCPDASAQNVSKLEPLENGRNTVCQRKEVVLSQMNALSNTPQEQEGLYKALFDCNCDISEENRFVVPFIIAAAVPYGKLYKENLEVNPTVSDTFTALMNCSRTNQIAKKMITFALRMTGCCPVKIQRIRNAGTQQTSTQNDDIHTLEDDKIKQSVLFHKLLVDIINDLPADQRRQVIYDSSEYLSWNPVHTQMLHVHFLLLIQGTVIGYKDVTKLHAMIESIRRPDILDTIDKYCREVGLPVLHRQGVCSVVQCHLVQGDCPDASAQNVSKLEPLENGRNTDIDALLHILRDHLRSLTETGKGNQRVCNICFKKKPINSHIVSGGVLEGACENCQSILVVDQRRHSLTITSPDGFKEKLECAECDHSTSHLEGKFIERLLKTKYYKPGTGLHEDDALLFLSYAYRMLSMRNVLEYAVEDEVASYQDLESFMVEVWKIRRGLLPQTESFARDKVLFHVFTDSETDAAEYRITLTPCKVDLTDLDLSLGYCPLIYVRALHCCWAVLLGRHRAADLHDHFQRMIHGIDRLLSKEKIEIRGFVRKNSLQFKV